MAVYQEPSPFEFIGQGLQNAATPIAQAMVGRNDNTQRDAEFLLRMVQGGAIDSDTANQTQTAQRLGLKFQPSPMELRRKILANPSGSPGAFGASASPDDVMSGNAPATPWSTDQRFAAGLPAASTEANEDVQGQIADIKKRYLKDPGSVSDSEASIAGLQTMRQQLEPQVTSAAQKYVSQVLNSTLSAGNIDSATPEGLRQLRRQSTNIAASAYNQFITDAKTQGNTAVTDPKNAGYYRSFFDNEVAKRLDQVEDNVIKTKALTPPKAAGMTDIDWANQWRKTSEDLDKEITDARKGTDYVIASTAKNPNPNQQAVLDSIHRKEMDALSFRKASVALMGGKTDADAIRKSLQADLENNTKLSHGAITPTGQGKGATPKKIAQPATDAQIKMAVARIASGAEKISDLQGLVNNGTLLPADFQNIVAQLPKPK